MGNISIKQDDITSGLYIEPDKYKYVDHKRQILDIEVQSSRIKSDKILEIEEFKVFENYKQIQDAIQDYKDDITYFYQNTDFVDNKIIINNSLKSCEKYSIEKRYDVRLNFRYKVTQVGEINLNLFDIFSGYKFNLKLKTTEETKDKFYNILIESERDKVIITLAELSIINSNGQIYSSDIGLSVSYIFAIKDKRFIKLTDNSHLKQKDIFSLSVRGYNILDLNVEDISYISKDDIRCFIGNEIKLLLLFNSEIENYIHIENFEYILNDEEILTTEDLSQNTHLTSITEDNIPLKEMNFLINKSIPISFSFDSWIYMRIKPYLNDLNDKLIFNFKSPNHIVNTLMLFNGHTDFKYLFNQNSESLDIMVNPSSGITYYKSSRYPIGDLTQKMLNNRWILYESSSILDKLIDLDIVELKI